MSFLDTLQARTVRILRWSEKYTKTDMTYLAQAGLWNNLNFVITSILALLLSIAFANFLPRDVYGNYQYLIALSGLLTAITLGGMNTAVVQSVARGYDGDLRESVRVQLIWSIVPTLIGLSGALYYYAEGNASIAFGLTAISLLSPIWNVFNTYSAFLNGKRDFKRIFSYGTVINVIYYVLIFLCVLFWKNVIALVFVNLASNALATIYFYFRTLRVYRPSEEIDPHTIPYGIHLSVMNAIGAVVTQLDSVLVFHFLGAAELAAYSFASLLPERVGGLFKFVSVAALPKFSNKSRQEIAQNILSKTLRAALAGIVAALLYAVFAPILFHTFFSKYLDAIPYTVIYSLVIITMAANIPTTALYALRLHRELYAFNIINPIILLALQVPLLLLFGISGILIARVISNTINIILALLFIYFPFSKNEADESLKPVETK